MSWPVLVCSCLVYYKRHYGTEQEKQRWLDHLDFVKDAEEAEKRYPPPKSDAWFEFNGWQKVRAQIVEQQIKIKMMKEEDAKQAAAKAREQDEF